MPFTDPVVSTLTLEFFNLRILSFKPALPLIKEDKPGDSTSTPNKLVNDGRRISASISNTFSIRPSASAILRATVDLPSLGTEEVTSTTLFLSSMLDKTNAVRTDRMASAK